MTSDRKILDQGTSNIEASVAKMAAELRMGFEKVAQIRRPAVALFGSARVAEGSKPYERARAVGRRSGGRSGDGGYGSQGRPAGLRISDSATATAGDEAAPDLQAGKSCAVAKALALVGVS